MEYYSAVKKNTFESVLMRWMKLELIIQSEVSQKEKHQYSILTHVYGIQKDVNDDPVCKTAKKTQMCIINGLLDSEGEGESGMIWENGIETCILSCKNRITSLCPMQDTACLGLVHGDDPEGCCGEGGGRGVHVWERMYTRGGFMSMYGKTNTVL